MCCNTAASVGLPGISQQGLPRQEHGKAVCRKCALPGAAVARRAVHCWAGTEDRQSRVAFF